MTKWEYTEQELWRFNENGDSIFHVFGLTAVGNTVLAFAEARKGDGSDDQCPHDIRLRKSIDGGKTFAPVVGIQYVPDLSGIRGTVEGGKTAGADHAAILTADQRPVVEIPRAVPLAYVDQVFAGLLHRGVGIPGQILGDGG